jgi:two-component system, NarL family, invasion response regulator UvrY
MAVRGTRDRIRARRTRLLELVGEADCAERALQLAPALTPDMIVMDVRMPGLGGIEAARRMKATLPPTAVVLISTTRPDELPRDVENSGADAVIWKSELHPELLDRIWLRWRG